MDDNEAEDLAQFIEDGWEAAERAVYRLLTPQERKARLDTIMMLIEVSAYLRMIAEEQE